MQNLIEIPSFENYKIDNLGNIYSLYYNKFLSPKTDKYGYKIIGLMKNNKRFHIGIHRLVAMVFIENVENKATVNHKDGNKLNNNVDNLEWVSFNENYRHAIKIGLYSKCQDDKRISVIKFDLQNNKIEEFISIKQASKISGVNHGSISKCINGKYRQAGGFIWKFKEINLEIS